MMARHRKARLVRRLASVWFLAACLGGFPSRGNAEGMISVSGTGEVLARPTKVEIDISAGGVAELTSDANQKYFDAIRRTTDAFKKLEMKDLTIEERELSFADTATGGNTTRVVVGGAIRNVARGAAVEMPRPEVAISQSLRLVLDKIQQQDDATLRETIGKLIDTARDIGATVRQSSSNAGMSLVTFVVDDAEEHRELAYQKAFDAAKSRAARLAALAGATLGPVRSINEQQGPVVSARYINAMSLNSNGEARLTSETLGDIPVRVTLHVSFTLLDLQDERGSDGEKDTK
jgi:uncharacterized protein YggE